MDRISKAITDYYIKRNYITKEKRDIYVYGFNLIFADIINFSIILITGAVISKFFEGIIFLIVLCGLRRYCGGFHAKTFWLCRISMIVTFIIVLYISELLTKQQGILLMIIVINSISIVFISFVAPIENRNKRISSTQRKCNKNKSIMTTAVLSIISILLVVLNVVETGVIISITLSAVVILMIIGLVVEKEGKCHV